MDIAALAKAQSYDWAKVSQYLEFLGIQKAAASIFFLCGRWFGTEVPSPFALTLDTETVDAMEQYIITAGTFGFNARSSGSSRLRNSVSENAENTAKAKRSIIFKMFFPNADYLAKQYPWYDGRKIFLPFMWIYRFFHLLFSRRKGSLKALGDVVHGGEEELREAKLLNRLGWNIYSQK